MCKVTEEATILLVEDNEQLATLLVTIIQRQTSYCVTHAADGNSALASIEQTNPTLLILDYNLPDTNGLDLYKQIRERKRNEVIPTIFASTDFPHAALSNERTTHLDKPFSIRQVLNAIHTLLG